MTSQVRSIHLASIVSTTIAALVLSACGGAKQVAVKAPARHAEPIGLANIQPVPDAPTAATVVISDEILRACNIPDADAYFAFDSAKLTSLDLDPLGELASCFTQGPLAGRHMLLVGHADPRGPADYNMTLGQARADSVAAYLRAHGLDKPQASTTSRGAMDATGQDETGWAHDRRVDVSLEH